VQPVKRTSKEHGTTTKMTSANESSEEEFVDVPCIDCGKKVNVSQRYSVRKAENHEPIICKDCREAAQGVLKN
jgi:hypothetical protein